jgi:hypothetical protein
MTLGAALLTGCGPTNEESLGGQTSKVEPHQAGAPEFNSYAEVAKYKAEQAKKSTGGKSKPAAVEQSKSKAEKESPKTQ